MMRCIGPYVIDFIISNDLYCLRDSLGDSLESHAARLIWYDGSDYEVTKEVDELFCYNYGRFEVDATTGLQKTNDEILLLVQ